MLAQVNIGQEFNSSITSTTQIGDVVTLLLRGAFAVAGVILLFVFITSGYSIIAGAGKENSEELQKAKQSLTSALIGFGIIFVAYWIVRIIEIITGLHLLGA